MHPSNRRFRTSSTRSLGARPASDRSEGRRADFEVRDSERNACLAGGEGIIHPAAIGGILGANVAEFMEKAATAFSDDPPRELSSPELISYFSLAPEFLADQIVSAINQSWGISISDLMVRAAGDSYLI